MLDPLLRRYKDKGLQPLARSLPSGSAFAVTGLGLVAGLAAAGAAAGHRYGLALGLWLLNRLLDGLDGVVAREQRRQSDLGGYLDILADFAVYAALPIGLVAGRPSDEATIGLIALLASFYVNAASWMYLAAILEKRRAGAASRGEPTSVTMPTALVGGTETILFYCAFLLWPVAVGRLSFLMALLVAVGIAQRLVWARRNLRD